ncbi:DUF2637 domain-containing protein [Actinomadura rifamycini]|uniref:DUF2637 domain-containing protein n=1 Tax=Actinomadura rifamycini TaxID=31962 RepID=UPI00040411B8|nr:DUF2637 domain-containing protein [Actinomadura rifamycini]
MSTDPVPSAPARSGGPRYSRAQRRLLTAAAGLVVAALAAGAFALTYDTLRDLAVAGRVDDRWAPVYPAMADALIAVTLLSLVVTRGARWWTRLLRWGLLLLLAAGLAALAVQDAVWGLDALPGDPVRAGVAVAPHVILVLAVWLWLTMFKQIRVARPGAETAEVVETQRGHVKVLPALEASAEPDDATAPDVPAGDAARPSGLDILPGMGGPRVPAPDELPLDEQDPAFVEPEPVLDRALEPPRPRPAEPAPPVRALEPAHTPHDRTWADEPAPEPLPSREDEPAGDEPLPADEPPRGHERTPGYEPAWTDEPAAEHEPEQLPRPVPALLPTDVEVARAAGRPPRDPRTPARTTRPDIVVPDLDDHDSDTPAADRAEDPDAGEDPDDRWEPHPPPSTTFRSGPTPPAD